MYRLVGNYPIVMGKTALTVLVQQQDVSAVKVDGVSGTQAGQTGADDDDSLRHCEGYIGGYGDREGLVVREKILYICGSRCSRSMGRGGTNVEYRGRGFVWKAGGMCTEDAAN